MSGILVRDGTVVEAGQILVRLDETRPRATLELLHARHMAALALEARLIAERDNREKIVFPSILNPLMVDSNVRETVEGQANIFNARRTSLEGQTAILNRRMAQYSEEIVGLRGQIEAEDTQIALITDELTDVLNLLNKGLVRKPRLLELQRRKAEIEGSRSQNVAEIARVKQSIAEAELRIIELKSAMTREVVQQLTDVQAEIFDLKEQVHAAEDVLRRTDIRAPLPGTVVGLQIHTVGGVIRPGEDLLDIVPADDRLIVEARVDPNDIDIVYPGLAARVRLSAFNQRNVAPIEGILTFVSADRLTDERTGLSYYAARIELVDPDLASKLDGGELYPGMPAEVMIVTGGRTMLDYLLKPINRSLERAFREN